MKRRNTMVRQIVLIAIGLLGMFSISCSHSKPAVDANFKRYQLTGRVVAIDKANKSLTVDGNEIPGFMSAMQMPYEVKDAALLDKLSPGDKISADIVVNGDESWLQNIKVTEPAPKPGSRLGSVDVEAA